MSGGAAEYIPQAAMMSFQPINAIHQHLYGLHCYAIDRTRAVPSHHFCSCAPTDGVRQCVIYDSDKADARLIGIEYVVNEEVFVALPEEEKKYWHSHKFEVESGTLQLMAKRGIPTAAVDLAERAAMAELHTTYGKTIHTWAVDSSPRLPLGPPSVMMSTDEHMDPATLSKFEERAGATLEHRREERAKYLNLQYEVKEGADGWKSGKAVDLVAEDREVKLGEGAWRGKESSDGF